MIINGEQGSHFYSDKKDRHLTAIAANNNRQIITERLITVKSAGKELDANYITKVTLLGWKEKTI